MTRRYVIGVTGICSVLLAPGPFSADERVDVHVRVVEDRMYGRVAYRYSIENNTAAHSIVAFRVGEDARRARAQLRQPPYGWTHERGLPMGSALAPDGWTVEAVREDDEALWFVEWFASEADDTLDISPGEMRDGFSLIVFDAAAEYLTSHWTVVFDNGRRVSGKLERGERSAQREPLASAGSRRKRRRPFARFSEFVPPLGSGVPSRAVTRNGRHAQIRGVFRRVQKASVLPEGWQEMFRWTRSPHVVRFFRSCI